MTTTADRIARLVEPVAAALDVTVYDIEDASGTMRILLDRPGGVDVDTLSDASRRISRAMDEATTFDSVVALEVSSPGLERKLRTPEHFAGAIGETIKAKLRPGLDVDRRVEGVLRAADEHTITVMDPDGDDRTVSIDDITSARTVFVWEPTPKPGKQARDQGKQRAPGRPTAAAGSDEPDLIDEPDPIDETEATE